MFDPVNLTKWWIINILKVDVLDYNSGKISKEDFIIYMRYVIKKINELLEEEERNED